MESLIQISKINDFLFCPRSLYFHSVYESFSDATYHASPQARGRLNHRTVDEGTYGPDGRYLQGEEVYSERYGLVGKIDLFDKETKTLIERKSNVKMVHQGYRFQLYAQYFSLSEAGFPVERLVIRSLDDNRRYEVPLPEGDELYAFEGTLDRMRAFDVADAPLEKNTAKCRGCIYRTLCRPEGSIMEQSYAHTA
ncbi:MAG: type V CRISPR-associated protein Cas4 [Candidatus Moranbacteria bacterium]|nr:type V CRISPR-associated protein Cas4 [Candidatus Moranbacteria bacterium]